MNLFVQVQQEFAVLIFWKSHQKCFVHHIYYRKIITIKSEHTFYVKFCTSQSGRQLSSCYSHPWFLKSFFVSLTVFLNSCLEFFFSYEWLFLVILLLHIECFSWTRKKFQLRLWLAAEQVFQSLSFKLSLFYAEIAQGMSGESEQIFLYSCLWLEALSFWSRYFSNSCSLL